MFQLLYPLGLLAALGITIPILIHLWNIKSGKTIKVGSVLLFGSPSNQRSRRIKVQDWPLLLLRCLLILLIAFIIAGPVFRQQQKSSGVTGWVLLEKTAFSKLWKQQHHLLDSLTKKGYEIHDFDIAFEKIDLKDTLTTFSREDKRSIPYFSLLTQLDSQLPQGTNIYLFTDNKLALFDGKRPQTHLNLNWSFVSSESRERSWPAFAFEMQSGRIKQFSAKADTLGTYYVSEETNQPAEEISIDTSTIQIQMYADKNAQDAAYLSSAVLAIGDFSKRKIRFEKIQSAAEISSQADLVFWLSDRRLSAKEQERLNKSKVLFTYAGRKINILNSSITDLSGISPQPASLYRRTEIKDDSGRPVWVDGSGTPVLSKVELKGVTRYDFYSRFRPDWTDLVWTEHMMSFLLPVVLPETNAESGFKDKGTLLVSPDDIALSKVSKINGKADVKYKEESLSPWIWWILMLVFFTERWISFRKNSVTT